MICQLVRGWFLVDSLAKAPTLPRQTLPLVSSDIGLRAWWRAKEEGARGRVAPLINLARVRPPPSPVIVVVQNFLSSYHYLTAIYLRLRPDCSHPYLYFLLSPIINHYLRLR